MGKEKAPERLRLVEPERSPEEKSAALIPSPENAQWSVVPGSTFSVEMEVVSWSPSSIEEGSKVME